MNNGLTNLTLRQVIDRGPHQHYEIHKGSLENVFSSAWVIDHRGLPNRCTAVFRTRQDELDWVRTKM